MPKHRKTARQTPLRSVRRRKYLQDFAALDAKAQQPHYSAILEWLADALLRRRKAHQRRVVGTEHRFQ